MTTKIILDKAGRVQPVRILGSIHKENGVWVYRGGQPADFSIRNLIEEGREERDRKIYQST